MLAWKTLALTNIVQGKAVAAQRELRETYRDNKNTPANTAADIPISMGAIPTIMPVAVAIPLPPRNPAKTVHT